MSLNGIRKVRDLMIRGTTPTFEFTLPFAASTLAVCYITFSQKGRTVVEKNLSDCTVSGKKITLKLSQSDTLRFRDEYVEIQIRGKTFDGEAIASNIMSEHASKILKDGVI